MDYVLVYLKLYAYSVFTDTQPVFEVVGGGNTENDNFSLKKKKLFVPPSIVF